MCFEPDTFASDGEDRSQAKEKVSSETQSKIRDGEIVSDANPFGSSHSQLLRSHARASKVDLARFS
jgi:hypothetical protein